MGRFVPPIEGVEPCSVGEWEAEFARSDDATFFHSLTWSRLWEQYSSGRFTPAPLRVHFADGSSAVLARTVQRSAYGVVHWHLSPAATYGGWLASPRLPDASARALVRLMDPVRSVVWAGVPSLLGIASARSTRGTTHLVDLGDGAEAARARWVPSARNKVRRALRSGVGIREAQRWSDWEAYFRSYLETMKLWRAPKSYYSASFFRLLWETRSPAIRLWLAEQHGSVVGGALVFTNGDSAWWWHAAQAPRVSGAANLLQSEILEALEAVGVRTYDLGASGGQQGVASFKESLGARAVQFPLLVRRHPLQRCASLIRQALPGPRPWAGVREP